MRYFLFIFLSLTLSLPAFSQEEEKGETDPQSSDSPTTIKKVDTTKLRKRYLRANKEVELKIVQARTYSKANRFKLGAQYGFINGDPFLSTRGISFSAGYYFSEFLSVQAHYWKLMSDPSDAKTTTESEDGLSGLVLPKNDLYSFVGADISFNPIYGKLSVLGDSVIYFDLYAFIGVGTLSTETGSYFVPYLGVGQMIYLTKVISLDLKYMGMTYRETLTKSVINGSISSEATERRNNTGAFYIGFSFLL